MISPAETTTSSPRRSCPDGTSSTPSAPRRCATVSARVLRSSSACALPRPSATASARFANRTVNHSQTAISQAKTLGSVIARIVTRTLPISTTNMTGLRAMRRGSSLRTLSAAARERIAGSRRRGFRHQSISCSRIGPRASTGRYVRPTTISTTPTSRLAKSGVPVGNVPAVAGTVCLRASDAGDREHDDDREEPSAEHREAERRVEPVGVPGQPAEGRAVVVRRRGERVDDLGEAVWARVEDRRLGLVEQHRDGGEAEHERRHDEEVERRRASSPPPGSSCRGTRAFVPPSARR